MRGTTCNNLLFKPMLTTDLSATYDDFVPYTGDSGRLNEDVANFFDIVRPVGSLYPTTDASFDPNTAKGWHGTWERIKDCVIYAAGDSDTVGQIVGSNTHTLTTAELPSHTHSIPALSGNTNKAGNHIHEGNDQYNLQMGAGTEIWRLHIVGHLMQFMVTRGHAGNSYSHSNNRRKYNRLSRFWNCH